MLYLFSHSISKTLLRPKTIRPPEMTTPYLSGNLARLFSIAPSRLHRVLMLQMDTYSIPSASCI